MSNSSKILALTLFFVAGLAYVASAQLPPVGNSSNVPIDGGVVTVLGASLVYGAKKLYERNKQKGE